MTLPIDAHPTDADPWVGQRRRGRRKSERKLRVLDTADLLALFECADLPTLLTKLNELQIHAHATRGPGGSTSVFVSDYQLPR